MATLNFEKHGFFASDKCWIKLINISDTEQGMLVVEKESDEEEAIYAIDFDDCRGLKDAKYTGKIRSQIFLDTLIEDMDYPH